MRLISYLLIKAKYILSIIRNNLYLRYRKKYFELILHLINHLKIHTCILNTITYYIEDRNLRSK